MKEGKKVSEELRQIRNMENKLGTAVAKHRITMDALYLEVQGHSIFERYPIPSYINSYIIPIFKAGPSSH